MVNADITGRKSDVTCLKDKLTGDRLGRTYTIRTTQLFSCKREGRNHREGLRWVNLKLTSLKLTWQSVPDKAYQLEK